MSRIAVIGSGMSGLAAAFRLSEAGHTVALYESADRLGGKLKSTRRDGFVLDQGASVVPSTYTSVLDIAKDCGVEDRVERAGSVQGYARGSKIHAVHGARGLLRSRLLSTRSKFRLGRLPLDVRRVRKFLSYEDLSVGAELDTETVREYAHRRFNSEIHDFLIEPSVRALIQTSSDQLSALDYLFMIDKFVSAEYLTTFAEGMSSLAEHLAPRFECHTRTTVEQVEQVGNEVVVTSRSPEGERIDRVEGAVIATAAPVAAAVYTNLDEWRRDFLGRVPYSCTVNVNLALSRQPAGLPMRSIHVPASVHPGIVTFTLDHNKHADRQPPGMGQLGIYAASDYARPLLDRDDNAIVDSLVCEAEQIIPDFSDQIRFALVSRWSTSVMHAMPGHWSQMKTFQRIRAERDDLVQLAGDYFATSNLNTAAVAGERATRELLAKLPGSTSRASGRGGSPSS